MRILVAEDDRGTHRMLQSLLTKWGYEVVSAYDGYEALEILRGEDPPNLLLLDRIMPGIDGDEVCKQVRQSEDHRVVHVIYLTVKDTKDDVVFGLEEGAHDYITKPFHENELKARVDVGSRMVELQLELSQNIELLRKKERELKKSLDEKEVLLREVHHRVKNNLNIIISLIGLEENNPGKTGAEVLAELKNRVHSIYSVHEKLFTQDQFINLNIREYLDDLVGNLFDTFFSKAAGINYVLEMNDVELPVEMVVPIGLIITEVATNSLKYAFEDGEEGTIRISLSAGSDAVYMKISDNGKKAVGEIQLDSAETLGLRLVKALTDQLHGEVEVTQEEGVGFSFTFPLGEKKA